MRQPRSRRSAAREAHISLRVKPEQKALLARAARLRHITLTEFILDNALRAASQLVAEEDQLRMTPEQFNQFCRALDAPPARSLKAMRRLLNQPTNLDE